MKILVGSRALNFWEPSLKLKDTTDWDILSDNPIEGSEWHNPEFLDSYKLEQFASPYTLQYKGQQLNVLSMQGCIVMKRSHLWRDLSFDKHILHWYKYMQRHTVRLSEPARQLLKQRTTATIKEFSLGSPSLNKTVKEFFDDAVTKKYDHDLLHELLAFEDKPLYTRMQVDASRAWCEKTLWDQFSYLQKIHCAAEETYVIAVERFLATSDWQTPTRLAYTKALRKVCTTLTSGWFRDFALDNFPEILAQYDHQRFESCKSKLYNLKLL